MFIHPCGKILLESAAFPGNQVEGIKGRIFDRFERPVDRLLINNLKPPLQIRHAEEEKEQGKDYPFNFHCRVMVKRSGMRDEYKFAIKLKSEVNERTKPC